MSITVSQRCNAQEHSRERRGRRGQAMVEFALCFLLFMAVVFGFSQIAMAI
jgi:Flp pilus assembly protein TadG